MLAINTGDGHRNSCAIRQAATKMNSKSKLLLLKQTIPLSAIAILAALALAGCNQSNQSNSTEKRSPNSSMGHDRGIMHGTANIMATNNMPQMNTNMPASHN